MPESINSSEFGVHLSVEHVKCEKLGKSMGHTYRHLYVLSCVQVKGTQRGRVAYEDGGKKGTGSQRVWALACN